MRLWTYEAAESAAQEFRPWVGKAVRIRWKPPILGALVVFGDVLAVARRMGWEVDDEYPCDLILRSPGDDVISIPLSRIMRIEEISSLA